MVTAVEVVRNRTAMALRSKPKGSPDVICKEREKPRLTLGVLTRATE